MKLGLVFLTRWLLIYELTPQDENWKWDVVGDWSEALMESYHNPHWETYYSPFPLKTTSRDGVSIVSQNKN